jgi:hypothetical protein
MLSERDKPDPGRRDGITRWALGILALLAILWELHRGSVPREVGILVLLGFGLAVIAVALNALRRVDRATRRGALWIGGAAVGFLVACFTLAALAHLATGGLLRDLTSGPPSFLEVSTPLVLVADIGFAVSLIATGRRAAAIGALGVLWLVVFGPFPFP